MDRRKQSTYHRRATAYGGRSRVHVAAPVQQVQADRVAPTRKRRKFTWTRRSLLVVVGLAILFVGGGATYAQLGPSLTQSSATGVNLQKGLIGWWKMDGNLRDSSVSRVSGTANSLITSSDRHNTVNMAYSLDSSTNSRVTIGTSATYIMGTQDWSVAIWAKTSSPSAQTIISKRNAGPANGYQVTINANGTVTALFATGQNQ